MTDTTFNHEPRMHLATVLRTALKQRLHCFKRDVPEFSCPATFMGFTEKLTYANQLCAAWPTSMSVADDPSIGYNALKCATRHSGASQAVNRGVQIDDVAFILSQTTVSITRGRYAETLARNTPESLGDRMQA